MGVIDRKRRLFDQIVRLRRAERAHPDDEDILVVRAQLEQDLGSVVSMSLAADLLGVSHTTVRRWIEAGEIPKLTDPSGRSGVPVQALLRLHEQVHQDRQSGSRSLHLIEPVVMESLRKASRLNASRLIADADDGSNDGSRDHHERAQLRSLAYHRALARQLRRPMVDEALHRIWQWRSEGRIDPRYAQSWEDVLRRPLPEIRKVMGENSVRGIDLRQNSPFAGMLSEAERRKILHEIR
jgi:excisionase family DNA binding protein